MPGLIAHTGQIWLAVDPVDMRRFVDDRTAGFGSSTLCGLGFYILQPRGESHQGLAVGRHGSMAMPAPFASGAVRLAEAWGSLCRVDVIAVGMADCRGELATVIGFAISTATGIKKRNNHLLSPSSSTWNPPGSSFTGTFARSTPANPVKPSQQNPSLRRSLMAAWPPLACLPG